MPTIPDLLPSLEMILDALPGLSVVLVSLVALAGLLLQRARAFEVVVGTLRAGTGVAVLAAGTALTLLSLGEMSPLLTAAFGIDAHGTTGSDLRGVLPDSRAALSMAQTLDLPMIAALALGGLAVALLLARVTPLRVVPLSGTTVLLLAALLAQVLAGSGAGRGASILVGSAVAGVVLVALPVLLQPFVRRATGGAPVAISDLGATGLIAAGAAGRLVDPRGHSRTTDPLPTSGDAVPMRGTAIGAVAVMLLLSVAIGIAELESARARAEAPLLDPLVIAALSIIGLGLSLALGLILIHVGAQRLLRSLLPAFRGIAERVLPGAVPALPVQVLFPFAPNAVLIGFVASLAAGMGAGLGLMAAGGIRLAADLTVAEGTAVASWVVLPSLVAHLLSGGAAGVIGNATGGRRGAVAGAVVNGLLITVLPLVLLAALGLSGWDDTVFADTDLAWLGALLSLGTVSSPVVSILVLLAIGAALLGAAILVQRRIVDAGWDPAPHRRAPGTVEVIEKSARP